MSGTRETPTRFLQSQLGLIQLKDSRLLYVTLSSKLIVEFLLKFQGILRIFEKFDQHRLTTAARHRTAPILDAENLRKRQQTRDYTRGTGKGGGGEQWRGGDVKPSRIADAAAATEWHRLMGCLILQVVEE